VAYEHLEVWRGDPEFGPWRDSLPDLVRACVERWSLEVGSPWTNSVASLTMPATRDGNPVVLKIGVPDREGEFEGEALRQQHGAGAVRLLDEDRERRALLLERCEPGTHRDGVGAERPAVPDRIWPGGVECGHELLAPAERADGEASANQLSQRDEVRLECVAGAEACVVEPEGDDLVEHEQDPAADGLPPDERDEVGGCRP
jgi:hypothetical protein